MHIQWQDYINIEAPAEARGGEAARNAREGRGAEVRWRSLFLHAALTSTVSQLATRVWSCASKC